MKTETCQPRIDRIRVDDVMHRGVFTCEQEARLSEVAATMAREHVHCVVVESDNDEGGPLWGIVSDLDLVAASTVRDLDDQSAGGSAATPVVTVSPNESLGRAAQLMNRAQHGALGRRRPRTSDRSAVDDRHRGRPRGPLARSEMATSETALARPPALSRLAGHYLPDLVYGANDGIITTFAVVSGVVGASLSVRVIVILGLANLVADGFSMGASNYLARRSHVEEDLADRRDALRHAFATIVGFVIAGVLPLIAYLLPLEPEVQFPASIALAASALFAVGAARTFVTRRGFLRSGIEMLLVGALAAVVAFGIGAFAASFA